MKHLSDGVIIIEHLFEQVLEAQALAVLLGGLHVSFLPSELLLQLRMFVISS